MIFIPTKEYTVSKSCIETYDNTFLVQEHQKELKVILMSIHRKRKEEKVLYLLSIDVWYILGKMTASDIYER